MLAERRKIEDEKLRKKEGTAETLAEKGAKKGKEIYSEGEQ